MIHVLGTVMGFDVVKIWHKERSLDAYGPLDGIVLPGGFPTVIIRSGAIARFSDIMPEVVRFANNGGPVWGYL